MTNRKKKISADISEEAALLLQGLVEKHERSKGWLLDKMIRTFCEQETMPAKAEKPVTKSKAFKAPTVEEVWQYCNERCNNVDAQEFVDHYTANNWFRGKTKIKDWKACVRTWEKNSVKTQVKAQGKTSGNLQACEGFING